MIFFFMFLGGAMTLNLGVDSQVYGWTTFVGRMPYIAVSILAGFASNEFILKLKEIASSIFSPMQQPSELEKKPPYARSDTGKHPGE